MSDQLVDQLKEDIRALIDNLTDPNRLEISRIRNVSTSICRRWLIDKGLVNLAHSLGVKPSLPALDNASHVTDIEKWKYVEFYTLGGVSLEGQPINSIFKMRTGFPGRANFSIPKKKDFPPARFLRRKCAFGQGVWFTAEHILRHMANKAGGVHFDTAREKVIDERIDEVRQNYLINSSADVLKMSGPKYIEIEGKFEEQFDFCFLEMMSIAQSLCNVRFDQKRVVHMRRIREDNTGYGDDILLGHTHHFRVDLPET
ncbi:hypothetical protein [Roseovarius sp. 2305UL8-3]|uniref:hypothetical protein n=1 Tax=Roseovarius conchicola TaxID=3121636 RepID=UPI003528E61E